MSWSTVWLSRRSTGKRPLVPRWRGVAFDGRKGPTPSVKRRLGWREKAALNVARGTGTCVALTASSCATADHLKPRS